MQFIDLKAQYAALRGEINANIQAVLDSAQFIGGPQVKQLEQELAAKGFQFSSANSINIGRLVPQIVYYFWAYLQAVRMGEIKNGEALNFTVPTGNFGDILAGWYAMKMGLPVGETPGLGPWRKFLERRHAAETKEPINIALVGKYDLQDAYKSIREALSQAGTYNDRKVEVHFVNSEKLTDENVGEALKGMAGVMIGPGFGQRGIDGKFVAIKYTRTHDIPTFGICLGMQCIAIEFARNVLGYADANSREMDEKTPHNVIDIMEEQKAITNMGGTMRLGAYECVLQKGSKAYQAYGQEHIQERHRHRYEFNNDYKDRYEAAGMKCVGINPESDLVEIVEIPALKWFVGTQFHPEYGSTVLNPHPLFVAFVKAAIENEKTTAKG